MQITIAVDAMGGDVGVSITVPAVLDFLKEIPEARVVLVGQESMVMPELKRLKAVDHPRLAFHSATEVVAMDESPALALKNKKDSSMRVCANLVKEGRAQALVSSGNTGALMAISRFVLKTIPGIDRPAIAKQLPTLNGSTCVLDLGANVDCTPEHLQQFAIMGSCLVEATQHKPRPTVGLLNIGTEAMKGNELVRNTGDLLAQTDINYYGNVEGNDIYLGTVDVIVCDGFTGNVALKASEGLSRMLAAFIKAEFTRNPLTWLVGLIAYPVMGKFKKRVDTRRYNGASLVGLRGIVVKSHGGADRFAFKCALERAYEEAQSGVIPRIEAQVSRRLDSAVAVAPVSAPSV